MKIEERNCVMIVEAVGGKNNDKKSHMDKLYRAAVVLPNLLHFLHKHHPFSEHSLPLLFA